MLFQLVKSNIIAFKETGVIYMAEKTQEGFGKQGYEQISAEFKAYEASLSEADQNDSSLWGKFLLKREDDGSGMFARTVDDTLHGMRLDVVKLIEEGQTEKAVRLGSLTKALGEKYSKMFKPVEEQGGTRFERAISLAGQ